MVGLNDLRFVPRTESGVTTEKAVAPLPRNRLLTVTRTVGASAVTWPLVSVTIHSGSRRFQDSSSYAVHASVSRAYVDADELDAIIHACQIDVERHDAAA